MLCKQHDSLSCAARISEDCSTDAGARCFAWFHLGCLLCMQVVSSECRAMVGQVAGGGRTEKPMLKAGRAHHKYKAKRNSWPRVSGPASIMNDADCRAGC